jgi:hypothetical protein
VVIYSTLLEDGHKVCLIVRHADSQTNVLHDLGSLLIYHRLNFQEKDWLTLASSICDDFNPGGALGVMFNSALRTPGLRTNPSLMFTMWNFISVL